MWTRTVLAIGLLPVIGIYASTEITAQREDHTGLIVSTTSGRVEGYLDTETTTVPLRKWLGIRYAQDTAGENRWRPPQPIKLIPKPIFNATAYGPACLQGRADGGNGTSVQSEDCLRINVIALEDAKDLPVYLYSHGGGFDSGASSDPKIDGSYLAARGIVFASYNYRLSLFGFPHAAELAEKGETQNLGLLDTRAAVEWLHKNVAQFGGDPNKITLGGESVGAEITNFYLHAFSQNPLIRGAVMQSGDTAQPMWPLNDQIGKIATNMSCPTGRGLLDCLRKKSGLELKQTLLATGTQFQPVTDNITVWKDYVAQTIRGHTTRVPLLIGTNKDEGSLIVEGEPTAYLPDIVKYSKSNNLNFPFANITKLQELYPVPSEDFPSAYNASAGMWRDAHMHCLASNLATLRTTAFKLPVWRYRFDLVASNLNSRGARIGAFHGSDIRFVMGQWRTIALSPPFVPATPEEIAISDLMVTAWTNFIKDPQAGPRIPGWRRFDPEDTTSLAILGKNVTGADPGDHFTADRSCAYWNAILPIYPQVFPPCGSWTC
ncbi:putative carboxylesterase family protein [Lyophyllum shimeji]|uniref:Carboxylesterase family protein n=1 Tax=Lyophyllum shimeji TaxID=47721 RepID=A0A9P3PM71_LYOSH|nr:putative carboxylesterase family protein [Lyophyllum shimeji]